MQHHFSRYRIIVLFSCTILPQISQQVLALYRLSDTLYFSRLYIHLPYLTYKIQSPHRFGISVFLDYCSVDSLAL